MFNRMTAYVLLAALIVSTCSRYVIGAAFRANQKYVTASLCENRNRPWLHCNGNCYLTKKLRQTEEHEHNKAAKDNLSHIGSFFFEELVRYNGTCNAVAVIGSKLSQMADDQYLSCFHSRIFQPPKYSKLFPFF